MLDKLLRTQLLAIAKVTDQIVAKKLQKLSDAELISLFSDLHKWARGVLHDDGPSEGAPLSEEGPFEGATKAHVKFKTHVPFTLVKTSRTHPLSARIERELIRRDREAPPLSQEEETSIILMLRSNNKEKGWTK